MVPRNSKIFKKTSNEKMMTIKVEVNKKSTRKKLSRKNSIKKLRNFSKDGRWVKTNMKGK